MSRMFFFLIEPVCGGFAPSIKGDNDLSAKVSPYSLDELLVLLYEYEELREIDNKAWITVRLIDLWRAYSKLDKERKEAILLMGLFGYSSRTSGFLLGLSHVTLTKRFIAGLHQMQRTLNGGT